MACLAQRNGVSCWMFVTKGVCKLLFLAVIAELLDDSSQTNKRIPQTGIFNEL